MGAYKPLLTIDGISMIRRVYDMMRTVGADPIVVVTGYRREDIERHLSGLPVTFVHNPDYSTTQQIDSLKLAFKVLDGQCQRILISPADVPLVRYETVDKLVAHEAPFIRPVYHGSAGHPVVMDSSLAEKIIGYTGEGGLRGAIENTGVAICNVAVEDRAVTMDNDTPQDFAKLIEWHKTLGADRDK